MGFSSWQHEYFCSFVNSPIHYFTNSSIMLLIAFIPLLIHSFIDSNTTDSLGGRRATGAHISVRHQGPTGPWVGTAPRLQINVCPELHPGMSPNQTEASPERPPWGPLPKRQLPATSPTRPHSGTTLPSVCQRGNGSVPRKATSMWSHCRRNPHIMVGGGGAPTIMGSMLTNQHTFLKPLLCAATHGTGASAKWVPVAPPALLLGASLPLIRLRHSRSGPRPECSEAGMPDFALIS